MKVTFYARVSSDSEEQKKSIQSQIAYFDTYIASNQFERISEGIFCKKDGTIELTDGYYVDEGFSGAKSYKYRKAFQQMLLDARDRKFEIIFVKDIKRFGRNVRETLDSIAELRRYNVAVYFDDIKANTLNKSDDVKITIFAALAEEESTSKSASVHFGKMQGFKKGKWGGGKPYGYNMHEGRLVINEEEAETVKLIFQRYHLDGMGLRTIAMKLNELGIPTQSGKNIWDQSLISKILANRVYIGEIRSHRTRKIDINQNIIEKIPLDEQIIVQDETIRIIDDSLFNIVQTEKEKRFKMHGNFNMKDRLIVHADGTEEIITVNLLNRSETRYSNKHILSNLLKCGNCGGSLRRKVQKNPTKTYILWFCRNNDQFGKHKCSERNLQHEQQLLESIQEEINAHKDLDIKWETYLSYFLYLKYETEVFEDSVVILNEQLEKLLVKRDKILDLYVEQIMDKEQYKVTNEQINNDISYVKEQINKQVFKEKMISEDVLRYNHFIKKLRSVDVDNLTNSMLREIFDCIVIDTKQISSIFDYTLKWKFMGTSFGDLESKLMDKIKYREKVEEMIVIQDGEETLVSETVVEELNESEILETLKQVNSYAEPYL